METLFRDARYSLRLMTRNPGFTAAAILLLAIGIGSNTSVFTLTDSVLLRPLPVSRPHDLALLRWYAATDALPDSISGYFDMGGNGRKANSTSFSYEAFQSMRKAATDSIDLAGFAEIESVSLRLDASTQVARAQLVSGNFFATLGIRPAKGRAVAPEDDREDSPAAVAVAGHRFWETTLGGGRGPGTTVILNGHPFTIIGVAPAEFAGTLQAGSVPDLYLPLSAQPLLAQGDALLKKPGAWWIQILGRLRRGTSPSAAQARLNPVFRGTARLAMPSVKEENLPSLALEDGSRGQPEMRQTYVQPLLVLTGMAALILIIGCANLASLMLGRAPGRRQELAVRAALGAGRWDLIRQLLTESMLLGLLGGALGYLVASWATDLTASLLPSPADPGTLHVSPDLRTFLFMLAVSVLTGAASGIAPALRAGKAHPAPDLNAAGPRAGSAMLGWGGAFVGIQAALSLILLFGAALFVGTLRNLQRVDPGFPTDHALGFRIEPSLAGYKGPRLVALYDRIATDLAALPGVRSVTFSRNGLLRGSASVNRVAPLDKLEDPKAAIFSWMHVTRWNFLGAAGIPLLRGRAWDQSDEISGRPVAVISESLARLLFGDQDPLGRRFGFAGSSQVPPLEVIGVARDAHYDRLRDGARPSFYMPYTRNLDMADRMIFLVRSSGDLKSLLPAIRRRVAEADSSLPVVEARTLEEQAAHLLLRERQFALLATGFGVTALLLACVGLYGVLSYAVNRRRREIGIRLALGAAPKRVLGMVLRQASLPMIAGCLAGLMGAPVAARLLGGMLFGIEPSDPVALGLATLALLATAMLAACLPARRAARTDPMEVLRYE
jgi:predicted permease